MSNLSTGDATSPIYLMNFAASLNSFNNHRCDKNIDAVIFYLPQKLTKAMKIDDNSLQRKQDLFARRES